MNANGGSHFYEVAGQGRALVLIPGFTLDARIWDDQFEAFRAHHRMIRYDQRGVGVLSFLESVDSATVDSAGR